MKIAFIQSEMREFFSFMLMSAKLKQAGHEVEVFIFKNKFELLASLQDGILKNFDIFGFSSTTISFENDYDYAKSIKRQYHNSFIVFGGAHPTYNPEQVINNDCIGAVCIGEGIDAIVELVNKREETKIGYKCPTDIKNIWFKDYSTELEPIQDISLDKSFYECFLYKNKINTIKNPIRSISNIDEWTRPDYALYYDKYEELRNKPTKPAYIVRGCFFNCSFCYNPAYNKMYKGNKIFQCMDVDKAISEIKWLKDTYGFIYLQFLSDNMTIDKKWLKKFLVKYKKEIKKPFFMNCRANQIDKEIVGLLKDAGCDRVDFGVEHGNNFIRNDILQRNMSKEQIINCGKWFKEVGIRVQTTNIFGLPYEDFNKAWETVELNRQFTPEITKACILQPFENTEIYNYAKENNLLKDNLKYSGTTYQIGVKDNRSDQTNIKVKNEKQIIRLSYLLDFFVKYNFIPKWMGFIICSLPLNRLYKKYYVGIFKKHGLKYKGIK